MKSTLAIAGISPEKYVGLIINQKICNMSKSIEVRTISQYSYFCFASRSGEADTKAIIMLSESDTFIGYLHFMSDGCKLPKSEKRNGYFYFYYYYSELSLLVDMLRNEKPVYLIYMEDDQNNCRISTIQEPVGEGENTD